MANSIQIGRSRRNRQSRSSAGIIPNPLKFARVFSKPAPSSVKSKVIAIQVARSCAAAVAAADPKATLKYVKLTKKKREETIAPDTDPPEKMITAVLDVLSGKTSASSDSEALRAAAFAARASKKLSAAAFAVADDPDVRIQAIKWLGVISPKTLERAAIAGAVHDQLDQVRKITTSSVEPKETSIDELKQLVTTNSDSIAQLETNVDEIEAKLPGTPGPSNQTQK